MASNFLAESASRIFRSIKGHANRNMRRIACGWDSSGLLCPTKKPPKPVISFSPRNRQRMNWSCFVTGEKHLD